MRQWVLLRDSIGSRSSSIAFRGMYHHWQPGWQKLDRERYMLCLLLQAGSRGTVSAQHVDPAGIRRQAAQPRGPLLLLLMLLLLLLWSQLKYTVVPRCKRIRF